MDSQFEISSVLVTNNFDKVSN